MTQINTAIDVWAEHLGGFLGRCYSEFLHKQISRAANSIFAETFANLKFLQSPSGFASKFIVGHAILLLIDFEITPFARFAFLLHPFLSTAVPM